MNHRNFLQFQSSAHQLAQPAQLQQNHIFHQQPQHQQQQQATMFGQYQMPNQMTFLQPLNTIGDSSGLTPHDGSLLSTQSSFASSSILAAANTIELGTSTSPSSYTTHVIQSVGSTSHNDAVIRRLKQQQQPEQAEMLDFELHLSSEAANAAAAAATAAGQEVNLNDTLNNSNSVATPKQVSVLIIPWLII